MEELYVKPGNQERGWNDPPQFSYDLQQARTAPNRNLLTRRVAPPTQTGAVAPPIGSPSSNPLAPPPVGIAPPPLGSAPPPASVVATPPPDPGSQSEGEPDADAVMSVLHRALAACRRSASEQVCNDVAKRLRLLEDSWRAGKLSVCVRRRMEKLTGELQTGRWDSANQLHLSLMVDHVTEVSQWMVGVKRLIAETRNLSPDVLELLLDGPGPQLDQHQNQDSVPLQNQDQNQNQNQN